MNRLFYLLIISCSLSAMQPAQWFRDAAPLVQKELESEALEDARQKSAKDADNATFELINLSPMLKDPLGFPRGQIIQKVDWLLKRGANPNAQYITTPGIQRSAVPVISQALQHFPEVVELLLQAGADPDRKTLLAEPIIFTAIQFNSPRLVDLLLQYGANPNIESILGNTPLIKSIKIGNPQIVRLLVQAGADPYFENMMRKLINRDNRQVKNLNEIFKREEAPKSTHEHPTPVELAQQKLKEAQTPATQENYRQIVEMLEHPEKIKRTGMQKLR